MNKFLLTLATFGFASGSIFAAQEKNPCAAIEPGMGIAEKNTCFSAGYNTPANIVLKDQIDFTGQVSFIYWYVAQSNMSVGTHNHTLANGMTETRYMYPEFEFKPGFKIGGAVDTKYDDWRIVAEYTWLHQSTHHNFHVEASTYSIPQSTNWKMHMDMLDFGLNRALYRSKRITLSPTAGLKALWIRERLTTRSASSDMISPSISKFYSWGFGPSFATNANYLFDYGLRFEGKLGIAALYTRYSDISKNISSNGVSGFSGTLTTSPNYSAVRPMAEVGLGMGWGMYLDHEQYYIDLSARYDFNAFWSQNQLFNDGQTPLGDLYMHGLTLTGRFDF